MKGSKKVMDRLNEALKLELGAIINTGATKFLKEESEHIQILEAWVAREAWNIKQMVEEAVT